MTESDKQTVEEIRKNAAELTVLIGQEEINGSLLFGQPVLKQMEVALRILDSQALEIAEARSSAAQYRDAGFNFDGYDTFEAQQQAKQEYIKAHPLPWEQEAK
jgi:hypothetical protein